MYLSTYKLLKRSLELALLLKSLNQDQHDKKEYNYNLKEFHSLLVFNDNINIFLSFYTLILIDATNNRVGFLLFHKIMKTISSLSTENFSSDQSNNTMMLGRTGLIETIYLNFSPSLTHLHFSKCWAENAMGKLNWPLISTKMYKSTVQSPFDSCIKNWRFPWRFVA